MRYLKYLRLVLLTTLLSVGIADAQEMHIKVAGTWQQVDEVHIKVAGTWRQVQEGWVRVGGAWQQFFANVAYALSWGGVEDLNSGACASYVEVKRDGDVVITANISGTPGADDWITPRDATVGDGYDVRWTVNSGDALTVGTAGSWLQISVNRQFGYSITGTGSLSGNHTVEIRPTGGGATLASNTFNMDCGAIP